MNNSDLTCKNDEKNTTPKNVSTVKTNITSNEIIMAQCSFEYFLFAFAFFPSRFNLVQLFLVFFRVFQFRQIDYIIIRAVVGFHNEFQPRLLSYRWKAFVCFYCFTVNEKECLKWLILNILTVNLRTHTKTQAFFVLDSSLVITLHDVNPIYTCCAKQKTTENICFYKASNTENLMLDKMKSHESLLFWNETSNRIENKRGTKLSASV